jgi:hypothetical protein
MGPAPLEGTGVMRVVLRYALFAVSLLGATGGDALISQAAQSVVVVVGAPGTDEYGAAFNEWAAKWRDAAERGSAEFTLIGTEESNSESSVDAPTDDRTRLKQVLDKRSEEDRDEPLWLVLIGHGSFDGETAKFNLRGPDVALKDLAEWLTPIKSTVAIIDCTSASAPLLGAASGPNRIVIAATKSGNELNYARFGQYLAEAIANSEADLDKDEQTSLLEAYLTACRGVAEFYESDSRLATEHALLDDNGDGLGTPAAWFRGLRATKRTKEDASLDGLRAHQLHLVRSERESQLAPQVRERRDEIEREIAALRERKPQLAENAYYTELESLLIELAHLYAIAATP